MLLSRPTIRTATVMFEKSTLARTILRSGHIELLNGLPKPNFWPRYTLPQKKGKYRRYSTAKRLNVSLFPIHHSLHHTTITPSLGFNNNIVSNILGLDPHHQQYMNITL